MIDGKQGDAFDENAHRTNNNRLDKRKYFSSTEGPFQSANNIFLFYGGADRSLIVNAVIHRVRKFPEPVIVTGESGSGKTMMSLVLGQKLETNFNVIQFDHTRCEHDQLLSHLVIELVPELLTAGSYGADMNSSATALLEANDPAKILVALCDKLRRGTPADKPVLLLVDVKSVDKSSYEMLLHLTQIINAHGRPFSCVIFAEDESLIASGVASESRAADSGTAVHDFSEPVAAGGLENRSADFSTDRSSVTSHYKLRRLNLAEATEYLQHHMLLFDYNKRDLFTREMAYFIADRSKGNCSTINTLARNAFLLAHLEGAERVSMGHLLLAGRPEKEESPETFLQKHRRGITLLSAFVLGSLAVSTMLVGILKVLG